MQLWVNGLLDEVKSIFNYTIKFKKDSSSKIYKSTGWIESDSVDDSLLKAIDHFMKTIVQDKKNRNDDIIVYVRSKNVVYKSNDFYKNWKNNRWTNSHGDNLRNWEVWKSLFDSLTRFKSFEIKYYSKEIMELHDPLPPKLTSHPKSRYSKPVQVITTKKTIMDIKGKKLSSILLKFRLAHTYIDFLKLLKNNLIKIDDGLVLSDNPFIQNRTMKITVCDKTLIIISVEDSLKRKIQSKTYK